MTLRARLRAVRELSEKTYAHFRYGLARQVDPDDDGTPYKGKGRALTDGELAASRCRMFITNLTLNPVIIPEGPNLAEHIVAKYGGFETAKPRRRC